jgi:hypothetical protein
MPKFGRQLLRLPGRETALSWPAIEGRFRELAAKNPAFGPLADLSSYLAHSAFAAVGLFGATSMHDLVIGPSAYVFQNPHLRIEFNFATRAFQMLYIDDSPVPWERTVSRDEIIPTVERFLIKRARWFRAT